MYAPAKSTLPPSMAVVCCGYITGFCCRRVFCRCWRQPREFIRTVAACLVSPDGRRISFRTKSTEPPHIRTLTRSTGTRAGYIYHSARNFLPITLQGSCKPAITAGAQANQHIQYCGCSTTTLNAVHRHVFGAVPIQKRRATDTGNQRSGQHPGLGIEQFLGHAGKREFGNKYRHGEANTAQQ
jgi:hypothetical protein